MKTMKLTFALLVIALGMSSCAALFGTSKDVLMSVQKGMTQQEVASILGKPDYRRFDHNTEDWEYVKPIAGNSGGTVITIGFEDGRVVAMDSFQDKPAPPVALYPTVEVSGGPVSRPHVSVGRGMNDAEFQSFYNKVKSKPFKDDRLNLLESGIGRRGISCQQCIRMMSIFQFDDDKLDVLRILAPNVVDRENGDKIINSLAFISSEEEARKILGIKK